MNARTISVAVLAVNLGLAGTLAYMLVSMKSDPRPAASSPTQFITNTVTQIAVRKINATNHLLGALANRAMSWQALEASDYPAYIENLRSFGCPEETIRDIIIADIAKLYAQMRSTLRQQAQGGRYWLTVDKTETPQVRLRLRELEKEEQKLVKDLLGVELKRELSKYTGEEFSVENTLSFLPAEKREQVAAMQEKYGELTQDIHARARGLLLPEDEEALRKIQLQRDAELAQILSPEELEGYQMRHSETANAVRESLDGFQPSEEEFQKIFRLQKAFDDQFDQPLAGMDENALAMRAKAEETAAAAWDGELQKALGPQRYAEYERTQDQEFRMLQQLGERYELPKEAINSVYDMKLAAERQKQQVELNANLTEQQREQMLAAIARETQRGVAGVMGEAAYKTYQRNAGQWIEGLATPDISLADLVPPPTPAPPVRPLPPLPPGMTPEVRDYLLNLPLPPNPQLNQSPSLRR